MRNSQWISALVTAASLCLSATSASVGAAEQYPNKPARLILPFGAGASTDIIGRIFAQRFGEMWGQQVIVDNRPGAGGIMGTEMAARATPDGYTLFTFGINQTITPHLHKKLAYDPLRDFAYLSLYAVMPNILCVNLNLPVATVGEFIKHAKANPGKLRYASSGIGATPHLTMALFAAMNGLDVVHVPYKVASQGYTDTIAGEIQTFFFNLPGPLPFVKAGRLRAIAVTSAKRAEQVPNVPTVIESGIPDFEVTVWQGYAMPKGVSPAHLKSVHTAMMKALAVPDLKTRFFDNGVSAAPQTPEEFGNFVRKEHARWGKAIAVSNIKVE